MKFFNEEQVRIVLITVRGQIREPLYDLAVKFGPTQGELLGLKWEDADFFHGTLKIKRQVQGETEVALQLCSLKTRASIRTFHLEDNTLDLLMHLNCTLIYQPVNRDKATSGFITQIIKWKIND